MTNNDVIDTLVKLCPTIKDEPEFNYGITKLWIYVVNKLAGQKLFRQSEKLSLSGHIIRCSDNEIILSGWLVYDDYYRTMINLANETLRLEKIQLILGE